MAEFDLVHPDSSSATPRVAKHRSWRKRVATFAIALLAGWLASTFVVTWKLTHRLQPMQGEVPLDVDGRSREDVILTTSDGELLGAWLFAGTADRPCALVMHGINSRRSQSVRLIEKLVRRGCTVLAVTLRAHGDSTGEINNIGWDARLDVIAAVRFLNERFPDEAVIVCGRSMSSAAAIFAAKDVGESVRGYWLEQPYPTLDSAVWHRLQTHLPPVFDWTAYVGMRMWAAVLVDPPIDQIAPIEHVAEIPASCVLHIVSGDADSHLPVADVESMFDRVQERAKLVLLPGVAHVLLDEAAPDAFEQALDEFLSAVANQPNP